MNGLNDIGLYPKMSTEFNFWNTTTIAPAPTLSPEMQYTMVNTIVIAIYANLLWISLLGNGIVFARLVRRKKKSRVHILLINLCTADSIVTLTEMPLKIAWKTTVQWTAGDATCRIVSCLRVFGLYLSALLLIAISIDRLLAICDPLSSVRRAAERTRVMIFFAWILSIACAVPQGVIWHVLAHPEFPWYHQCVTFGSFSSRSSEMFYGLSVMTLTYGLPLLTILCCYLGIWFKILKSSVQQGSTTINGSFRRNTNSSLRTNNVDRLTKAKTRTLRMTFFIVGIFILCWSPYQIMSMWYLFDRGSAMLVNQLAQEILFIFGVSSSVLNPYVYGMYSMGIWKKVDFLTICPWNWGRVRRKDDITDGLSRFDDGDTATMYDRERTLSKSFGCAQSVRMPNTLPVPHCNVVADTKLKRSPSIHSLDMIRRDDED